MPTKVTNGLDLDQTSLINAVIHPVTSDPSSPVDGQIWYRSDTDRLHIRANGVTETIADLGDITGGAITGALWDAQSVVVAVADDTPVAQVIGEGQVLGRATGGNIGPLTAAQLRTILNVEDGATGDQTAAEVLALLLTVDGAGSGLDADTLDGAQLSTLATKTYADTAAQNAAAAVVGGASAAYDTLLELQNELQSNDTEIASILTAQAGKTGKFATDVGNGTDTDIPVNHGLGTPDVVVQVREVASNEVVLADVTVTSANVVTIGFATAPSTNQFRVVVVG